MNSLIIAADLSTQLKIVMVALAASAVFAIVGLTGGIPTENARNAEASSVVVPVERIDVKPTGRSRTHAPEGGV